MTKSLYIVTGENLVITRFLPKIKNKYGKINKWLVGYVLFQVYGV